MQSRKPLFFGLAGGISILILYFGILSFANSFDHALMVFRNLWYWMILLTAGFGIQAGLYTYIRQTLKERTRGATVEVAAAGGISTGSMVACCAHHLTDVLPLLGLSAAAMFLTHYQIPFILLGVASNLVGITLMLNLIKKHELAPESGLLNRLTRINTRRLIKVMATLSAAVLLVAFLVVATRQPSGSKPVLHPEETILAHQPIELPAVNNSANQVSIDAKPVDFAFSKPVKIKIALNTHHGSLDYDLAKIATLICDRGNEHKPLGWEGSPPGGHHRRGELIFPKFNHKISHMKLVIKGIYDVPERVFEWTIS